MGSDLHMNPPAPPPIHEQVKALVDRNKEMGQTIKELRAKVVELEREGIAKDRTIARLSVQLQGQPFPGEDDHMSPDHPDYDDGTAAVLGFTPPPSGTYPIEETPDGRVIDPTTGKEYTTPQQPWCTCGVKSPQGHMHSFDCPANRNAR